ncbi:MAG: hypothetical protein AAFR38_00325 [Planctomycetota bacterium]
MQGVPKPEPDRPQDEPSREVLRFFLEPGERAEVLRVLRRYGTARSRALLAALGIEREPRR